MLDLPEFAAHWYVLVEVLEESEQAQIHGCFSYDRLASDALAVELDWNYTVPLERFTLNSDALLLNLRCLNPQAISLTDRSSGHCAGD